MTYYLGLLAENLKDMLLAWLKEAERWGLSMATAQLGKFNADLSKW